MATVSAVSPDVEVHNNVVLTAAESGTRLDSLQHNQNWNRQAGVGTSVAFGGKSRYLAIGDESGAVCLWDLKKRMRVRQFCHDGYASRQVSVDPSDTFVLSLSHAFLSVYNLREGNLSTTLDPPDRHMSFTKFHTSPLEAEKTAIGTRDGSVLVYDIHSQNRNTPLLTLDRRQSNAITGVSFSAVNSQLLASSSADGTLQFFDIRSGETIQELASLSAPITSLSIHAGGINCAVGTDTGEVLVYDLRQSSPLASMHAKGAVTGLQFAPIPKPKKDKNPTTPSVSVSKFNSYMDSARKDGDVPIKRTNTDLSAMRSESSSLKYFGSDAGKSKSYFGPPANQPSSAEKPSTWTPGKQNQTSNTSRNPPASQPSPAGNPSTWTPGKQNQTSNTSRNPPASQPSPAGNPSTWTPGKQNQTSNTSRNTPKQELKSELGESRLSSSFESRYSVSRTNEEKNIAEPRIRTVSHFWNMML
jgi:WD40 repeat protein